MKTFEIIVNCFLDICMLFNKALGIFSFGLFTGIDNSTLFRWLGPEGEKANPQRCYLLKTIKEYNQGALISNLKDTPVGALAVANNDIETGLQWSQNQVASITNNTVYMIPSERMDRLKLDSPTD